jgi:hypothetical protein
MGCFSAPQQQSTSYLPAQEDWLNKLLGQYGPQAGQGQVSYGGARVAPLTGTQTGALGQAGGFLSAFDPSRPLEVPQEYGSALSGLLGGTAGAQPISPEQTESYFSSAIQGPSSRYHREYAVPAVKEAFAGPGYWSSARATEQAEAGQDYANWLGEQRGQLEWDVQQENARRAQQQAQQQLGALPYAQQGAYLPSGVAQQQLQGLGGVFGFAGQEQQYQQQLIQSNIQQFLESNRITDPEVLNILLSLIGQPMQSSMSSGGGLGYTGLSSLFGGLGGGLGYGMTVPRTA